MTINELFNKNQYFFEKLEKIDKYHKMHSHCYRHLNKINEGSSRAIFELDNHYILKSAISHAGIFQNSNEFIISSQNPNLVFFEPAYTFSDSMKYIIMKKAQPLKNTILFEEKTGFDFSTVGNFSQDFSNYILHDKQVGVLKKRLDKYLDVLDYRLFKEIAYVSNYYKILLGDLNKKDSWGIVDNDIKILDYGLENIMFKLFGNNKGNIPINDIIHGKNNQKSYKGFIHIKPLRDFYINELKSGLSM